MSAPLDVDALRKQVPGLHREVHGHPLAYLDYAATAQRPQAVLDAVAHAYTTLNANVHRGVHTVSAEATAAFEAARARVARFLSTVPTQVVFTSGATDALNLAASGLAATRLAPGTRVLATLAEHHANLVPWQLAAERTGASVEPVPLTSRGTVDLGALERALCQGRVAVVACTLVSNVLGTRAPIEEVSRLCDQHGATLVVDAAQAAAHGPLDAAALGAHVLVFSGHKVYGPTGVGVLWARKELLEAWPPWKGGGDMIRRVAFSGTTFREPPARFEAGTPPIAQAIGLHAALDWLNNIGWAAIQAREEALTRYAEAALRGVPELHRVPGAPVVPLFSFTLGSIHPHDIGTLLDHEGVAVRTGRHCTDPLHTQLGLDATTRASLSFLNTREEIDRLVAGLHRVTEILG